MVIVIVHRSASNGEVGSMWHESFEFEETTPLKEVIERCREMNGFIKEDIIIPVKGL